MEKINDCQIKQVIMNKSNIKLMLLISILIGLNMPVGLNAQIRAGSGYLKMLHGAREVSHWGTTTAALDYTYSFYTNPAATGFLREWQWSATYTNWIGDIYHAAFLYGQKIRTPWSRWTRFALGLNYLGIPEFDNGSPVENAVSGNNLLVTASLGQPLSFLSQNLSLGFDVKYFSSELARYQTDAVLWDAGLLVRTPRIHLMNTGRALFDNLIISAGLSMTNNGSDMTFISEKTPLPQTKRAGIAVNMGAHSGFQTNLELDYRKIRDEDGFLTFGAELTWRKIFLLRAGYSWEDNLLGHFTFGGGIQLDDRLLHSTLWGRNNALRLDLAANETNQLFSSPYHGSITLEPIGPEGFRLLSPAYNQRIDEEQVLLRWETTREPDLFDELFYWLLVDQDSLKLAGIFNELKKSENLPQFLNSQNLLVSRSVTQNQFPMTDLRGGDYFWAVLAYDLDDHYKAGKIGQQVIAKFHITRPDPRIIAIDFKPDYWITEDKHQGILTFKIKNFGERAAKDCKLTFLDSLIAEITADNISPQLTRLLPAPKAIDSINPGDSLTIDFDWETELAGLHDIHAKIFENRANEKLLHSNRAQFYTIPKGKLTTPDSIIVQKKSRVIYDLPYVGKVFFDIESAEVKPIFLSEWCIKPTLALFAERLKNNPSIKITLQGTIDPNSRERVLSLADERSQAVKDSLNRLGVSLVQMEIIPGIELEKRKVPKNPEDARWVFEERRRVDITTTPENEKILFEPLQTSYTHRIDTSVTFISTITGVIPFKSGSLSIKAPQWKDSLNIPTQVRHISSLIWQPALKTKPEEEWLNQSAAYSLVVTDSLGRQFGVRPQQAVLKAQIIGIERRFYLLAKFQNTEPYYYFYWTNLLESVPFLLENPDTRMQFIGHGCATGPESINLSLSKKRANDFMNKFLTDMQKRYPDLYEKLKQRIDPSEGKGESEPLSCQREDGAKLSLGDNQLPLGRQLNRRVMIYFYTVY
ncbi:PorV/PorQ family protein [candidate division KSB1 bacterium]|nr:PorV/PorQ family protein [candidate division KSB1 bacterium]